MAAEQLGCCNDLAAGLGLAALAALQIMALLPLSDAGVPTASATPPSTDIQCSHSTPPTKRTMRLTATSHPMSVLLLATQFVSSLAQLSICP